MDAPAADLHWGPLADYVPAPTLRWLLLASPERIARHPGALEALTPLVDDAAWQRFASRNGVDLRATPSALVAGFELGTLYLVTAGDAGPAMESHFRERLLRGEVIERPHPRLTRVRGVVGKTPQALLHAQDQLVALSVDDPSLVRLVEGYLLGRFRQTPPALSGAALRAHAQFARDAPLRLFVPVPVEGGPGNLGPLGALEGISAALAAVELFDIRPCACRPKGPTGAGLRLHLAVAGPWDPSEASAQPLLDTWEALSKSATGQLLQLHTPLRAPQLGVSSLDDGDSRLELTIELALGPLVHGFRNTLSGELAQMFHSFGSAVEAPP